MVDAPPLSLPLPPGGMPSAECPLARHFADGKCHAGRPCPARVEDARPRLRALKSPLSIARHYIWPFTLIFTRPSHAYENIISRRHTGTTYAATTLPPSHVAPLLRRERRRHCRLAVQGDDADADATAGHARRALPPSPRRPTCQRPQAAHIPPPHTIAFGRS